MSVDRISEISPRSSSEERRGNDLPIPVSIWTRKFVRSLTQGELTPDEAMIALEQQFKREREIDTLTGFPDQNGLITALNRFIAATDKDPKVSLSLLFFDGDEFGNINKILGWDEGDRFIKKIGEELEKTRNNDNAKITFRNPMITFISRIYGDEFAIVLPNNNIEDSIPAAIRLQRHLSVAVSRDMPELQLRLGKLVTITVSVVEYARDYPLTAKRFLGQAKDVAKAAKQVGHWGGVAISHYNPDQEKFVSELIRDYTGPIKDAILLP